MSRGQGMLCHHRTCCSIHLRFVNFFTPLLLFPNRVWWSLGRCWHSCSWRSIPGIQAAAPALQPGKGAGRKPCLELGEPQLNHVAVFEYGICGVGFSGRAWKP